MKIRLITLFISIFYLSFTLKAQDKPNILFLFSDDQRADAIGAFGNPYIQTPNIDKLAYTGMRFTNNFCMGSHHGAVCAPSRAMLMSGRNLFRVYDKLDGIKTMPMVLGEHGYITFGTGKWHNEKTAFADGFQFGENIFFGGMSDHFNVPVVDMKENGSFTDVTKKGFSTVVFTDAAIRFIKEYSKGEKDKPFFAYVSYTVPHDPRSPDKDYIGLYGDENLPIPQNYMRKHPFILQDARGRDENLGAWPRSPEQIRAQLADYYGLISQLDDQVGRLLNTLKKLEMYDNTIIIFTSDHGLGMGSHGLLGKQNLYEHSMKSPLIITGPGIPVNQSSDALVYLYDLFPTFCSMLDIQPPAGVEGKDITPIIYQEQLEVRSSLFTAYTNYQRAVRNKRWKLIQFPKLNHTLLFDLQDDPYELNNLADDDIHSGKVSEMWQLLEKWQVSTGDTIKLVSQNPQPMDYDLSDHIRKPDRHQPEYTLKKYFED
ncbi:sulfatase-like hydrolase/transferase [Bacteroidota bacterium]